MSYRFTFALIISFWLTMTYLLWRQEYIGKNEVGSNIPVELVWRKILTAPDSSPLHILHDGKNVGYCQWSSRVGQDLISNKALTEDAGPEGMVEKPANYRLDVQGNLVQSDVGGRWNFHSEIKLSTNDEWQDFHFQLTKRPVTWEVFSHASDQTARLVMQAKGGPKSEQVYRFSDLENPQFLLQQFDVPMLGLLGALNPFPQLQNQKAFSLGLQWKARNDWIAFGHTQVRAYRVEAVLLERYRMIVIVSQVGEILRVDLPDGWELLNQQLISL